MAAVRVAVPVGVALRPPRPTTSTSSQWAFKEGCPVHNSSSATRPSCTTVPCHLPYQFLRRAVPATVLSCRQTWSCTRRDMVHRPRLPKVPLVPLRALQGVLHHPGSPPVVPEHPTGPTRSAGSVGTELRVTTSGESAAIRARPSSGGPSKTKHSGTSTALTTAAARSQSVPGNAANSAASTNACPSAWRKAGS